MFLTRKEDLMPFSGLLEEGAQSWHLAELMLFKPFFMATVEIFEAQEGEDEPFSMMRTWMADDVHTFVDLASKQNKNDIELRSGRCPELSCRFELVDGDHYAAKRCLFSLGRSLAMSAGSWAYPLMRRMLLSLSKNPITVQRSAMSAFW